MSTENTEWRGTEGTEMETQPIVLVREKDSTSYHKYPHSDITEKIIGCAIEVHKTLGPGFKESAYENALLCELTKCGLKYEQQKPVKITYKGTNVGRHRLDLIVEEKIVVELKTIRSLSSEDTKRLLSYLKATKIKVGLPLNFAKPVIEIKRLIL